MRQMARDFRQVSLESGVEWKDKVMLGIWTV